MQRNVLLRKQKKTGKQQIRQKNNDDKVNALELITRWAARKAYSRHDGIVPDDVADVSPEFLDESKTRFYEKEVVITQVEGEELEKPTRK